MSLALPSIDRTESAAGLGRLAPGLLLCAAVAAAAFALQGLEARFAGRAWLEAVALAILLGMALRTAWRPGETIAPGIGFGAKEGLEVAVVLLGATIDARTVLSVGLPLLAGIAGLVAAAIVVSFALGRLFRLPARMAILIACGNAICGNSAIAAVAPVIGAEGEDVAASIAFTAALGVAVVIGLPLLGGAIGLTHQAYGVFAGLTVYAVPQVIAATAPVSAASAQVGTVVKLVRVLMLGPVVAVLSILAPAAGRADPGVRVRPDLRRMAPWFIIGFAALAAARSFGLVPASAAALAGAAASLLTVVSMAALGLGVDVRALLGAGPRVSGVVVASLGVLGLLAFALMRAVHLA